MAIRSSPWRRCGHCTTRGDSIRVARARTRARCRSQRMSSASSKLVSPSPRPSSSRCSEPSRRTARRSIKRHSRAPSSRSVRSPSMRLLSSSHAACSATSTAASIFNTSRFEGSSSVRCPGRYAGGCTLTLLRPSSRRTRQTPSGSRTTSWRRTSPSAPFGISRSRVTARSACTLTRPRCSISVARPTSPTRPASHRKRTACSF